MSRVSKSRTSLTHAMRDETSLVEPCAPAAAKTSATPTVQQHQQEQQDSTLSTVATTTTTMIRPPYAALIGCLTSSRQKEAMARWLRAPLLIGLSSVDDKPIAEACVSLLPSTQMDVHKEIVEMVRAYDDAQTKRQQQSAPASTRKRTPTSGSASSAATPSPLLLPHEPSLYLRHIASIPLNSPEAARLWRDGYRRCCFCNKAVVFKNAAKHYEMASCGALAHRSSSNSKNDDHASPTDVSSSSSSLSSSSHRLADREALERLWAFGAQMDLEEVNQKAAVMNVMCGGGGGGGKGSLSVPPHRTTDDILAQFAMHPTTNSSSTSDAAALVTEHQPSRLFFGASSGGSLPNVPFDGRAANLFQTQIESSFTEVQRAFLSAFSSSFSSFSPSDSHGGPSKTIRLSQVFADRFKAPELITAIQHICGDRANSHHHHRAAGGGNVTPSSSPLALAPPSSFSSVAASSALPSAPSTVSLPSAAALCPPSALPPPPTTTTTTTATLSLLTAADYPKYLAYYKQWCKLPCYHALEGERELVRTAAGLMLVPLSRHCSWKESMDDYSKLVGVPLLPEGEKTTNIKNTTTATNKNVNVCHIAIAPYTSSAEAMLCPLPSSSTGAASAKKGRWPPMPPVGSVPTVSIAPPTAVATASSIKGGGASAKVKKAEGNTTSALSSSFSSSSSSSPSSSMTPAKLFAHHQQRLTALHAIVKGLAPQNAVRRCSTCCACVAYRNFSRHENTTVQCSEVCAKDYALQHHIYTQLLVDIEHRAFANGVALGPTAAERAFILKIAAEEGGAEGVLMKMREAMLFEKATLLAAEAAASMQKKDLSLSSSATTTVNGEDAAVDGDAKVKGGGGAAAVGEGGKRARSASDVLTPTNRAMAEGVGEGGGKARGRPDNKQNSTATLITDEAAVADGKQKNAKAGVVQALLFDRLFLDEARSRAGIEKQEVGESRLETREALERRRVQKREEASATRAVAAQLKHTEKQREQEEKLARQRMAFISHFIPNYASKDHRRDDSNGTAATIQSQPQPLSPPLSAAPPPLTIRCFAPEYACTSVRGVPFLLGTTLCGVYFQQPRKKKMKGHLARGGGGGAALHVSKDDDEDDNAACEETYSSQPAAAATTLHPSHSYSSSSSYTSSCITVTSDGILTYVNRHRHRFSLRPPSYSSSSSFSFSSPFSSSLPFALTVPKSLEKKVMAVLWVRDVLSRRENVRGLVGFIDVHNNASHQNHSNDVVDEESGVAQHHHRGGDDGTVPLVVTVPSDNFITPDDFIASCDALGLCPIRALKQAGGVGLADSLEGAVGERSEPPSSSDTPQPHHRGGDGDDNDNAPANNRLIAPPPHGGGARGEGSRSRGPPSSFPSSSLVVSQQLLAGMLPPLPLFVASVSGIAWEEDCGADGGPFPMGGDRSLPRKLRPHSNTTTTPVTFVVSNCSTLYPDLVYYDSDDMASDDEGNDDGRVSCL